MVSSVMVMRQWREGNPELWWWPTTEGPTEEVPVSTTLFRQVWTPIYQVWPDIILWTEQQIIRETSTILTLWTTIIVTTCTVQCHTEMFDWFYLHLKRWLTKSPTIFFIKVPTSWVKKPTITKQHTTCPAPVIITQSVSAMEAVIIKLCSNIPPQHHSPSWWSWNPQQWTGYK